MLNFLVFMLSTTLRMGTPIALTGLGGVVSEKAGVLNIGLEGIMVASAFGAVLGTHYSGNPWIGVLVAILLGVAIALVHSVVCITWGGNQSVSSMALVLLAGGFSGVAMKSVFNSQGTSPAVVSISKTQFLADIPVVGGFLSSLSPLVYISFILLAVTIYVFKHTPLGLRIIFVGEDPKSAETAGISVHKIRYLAVITSGVFGGLGGAFLSIAASNLYQDGMVAGRGYLALAAVVMGKWSPKGVYGAAMFFGFFEALQLYVQTMPNNNIPSEFIQMIPYISSLILLTISMKNAKNIGVTSSGKPYCKYI